MHLVLRRLLGLLLVALVTTTGSHVSYSQTLTIPCDAQALIHGINQANSTPNTPDTLYLAPNCMYSFGAGYPSQPDTALPRIISTITIYGREATIARIPSPARFRLFYVEPQGILTLENVKVHNGNVYVANTTNYGGGIYNLGTLNLSKTIISGNDATYGAGIYNLGNLYVDKNSNFRENHTSGTGARGGAIFQEGADSRATILDTTFNNNTSEGSGGAISSVFGGALYIRGSSFSYNSVAGGGGAIHIWDASSIIVDGRIFQNSAREGGGIANHGETMVVNTYLQGNSAEIRGGALYSVGISDLKITNSVITGNRAQEGGGLYTGTLTANAIVYNTVIATNLAVSNGGAIATAGIPSIHNSIVWGNVAVGYNSQFSGTVTVSYSVVQGGFSGEGNLSSDPMFANPAAISQVPTSQGEWWPKPVSPVINSGSNGLVGPDFSDLDGDSDSLEPTPQDIERSDRIKQGTADIGAFESPREQDVLLNGGFEQVDKGNPGGAANWVGANLSKDKRICNKIALGKIFARTGECAFRFKVNAGEKSIIKQIIKKDSPSPVSIVYLEAWSTGTSTVLLNAKVVYIDGLSDTLAVSLLPAGIYTNWSASLELTKVPKKYIVKLRPTGIAGKLYIDDIRFYEISVAQSLLPVPAENLLLPLPSGQVR